MYLIHLWVILMETIFFMQIDIIFLDDLQENYFSKKNKNFSLNYFRNELKFKIRLYYVKFQICNVFSRLNDFKSVPISFTKLVPLDWFDLLKKYKT